MSPIAFALLLVTPFWTVVGYLLRGWMGAGIALMVMGLLLILAHEVKPRPPRFLVIDEQRIGAFDKRGRMRLSRAERRRRAA